LLIDHSFPAQQVATFAGLAVLAPGILWAAVLVRLPGKAAG